VIGEIGCLSGAPRSATVAANTAVSAKVVARSAVLEALRKDPDLAMSFIGVLCARLTETDALVMSLSALRMRARLAGGLLQLAKRHGQDEEKGVRLDIQVTQRDLGAFVGLSRENVSRILAEWREARIVAAEPGGKLLLRDMERLEEIADSED
jgi:CRP-like cAMP-binding protein